MVPSSRTGVFVAAASTLYLFGPTPLTRKETQSMEKDSRSFLCITSKRGILRHPTKPRRAQS